MTISKIKISLVTTAALAAGLMGCGSNSGSGNSSPPPVNQAMVTPVSIDNAGIIPAFSNAAVTTHLFVHNNSNSNISNIKYTYAVNGVGTSTITPSVKSSSKKPTSLNKKASKSEVLSVSASGTCANISANSVCQLPISIPSIGKAHKGSALITLSYVVNGQTHTFNQVINFQVVNSDTTGSNGVNSLSGVFLSSGAVSSNFGNVGTSGYTTLYIYGAGKAGTTYKINDIKLDPILGKIVQGQLAGSTIAANSVQAIELNTTKVQKSAIGTITVDAEDSSTKKAYSSSQGVGVLADDDSGHPVVLSSLLPNINTAVTTSGTAYVYNAGDASATVGAVSASNGITLSADACSSQALSPGVSCSVGFTVSGTSGNGIISIPFSGGGDNKVSTTSVSWYGSQVNPGQLGMDSDADNGLSMVFYQPSVMHVNVYNLGGINFNAITIPAPTTTGSATAMLISGDVSNPNTCALISTESQLVANTGSCNYAVSVSDTTKSDTGVVTVSATGTPVSGGGNPSASDAVNYTVSADTPAFTIAAAAPAIATIGDNSTTATTNITYTNTGTGAVTLVTGSQTIQIDGSNVQVTEDGSCNGQTLANTADTCIESVTLVAQTLKTGNAQTATMVVSATAPNQAITIPESATVGLTVQPTSAAITNSSVVATGDDQQGHGTSASPIKFQAGVDSTKYVTFTYTNQISSLSGVTPESVTISGVTESSGMSLSSNWELAYTDSVDVPVDSTSCAGNLPSDPMHTNVVVAPGGNCTVTYYNNEYLYGDSNISTQLNIPFPVLLMKIGNTVQGLLTLDTSTYPDAVYYANNYQAQITDTEDFIPGNGGVQVNHAITGFSDGGYSNFTLRTEITPTQKLTINPESVAPGCTAASARGAVEENCPVSTDTANFTSTYAFNQSNLPLTGQVFQFGFYSDLQGSEWVSMNGSDGYDGINSAVDSLDFVWTYTYYIWTTATAVPPTFGGYAGASALCNDTTDSAYPHTPQQVGSYVALLDVTPTQAIEPDTTYYSAPSVGMVPYTPIFHTLATASTSTHSYVPAPPYLGALCPLSSPNCGTAANYCLNSGTLAWSVGVTSDSGGMPRSFGSFASGAAASAVQYNGYSNCDGYVPVSSYINTGVTYTNLGSNSQCLVSAASCRSSPPAHVFCVSAIPGS